MVARFWVRVGVKAKVRVARFWVRAKGRVRVRIHRSVKEPPPPHTERYLAADAERTVGKRVRGTYAEV